MAKMKTSGSSSGGSINPSKYVPKTQYGTKKLIMMAKRDDAREMAGNYRAKAQAKPKANSPIVGMEKTAAKKRAASKIGIFMQKGKAEGARRTASGYRTAAAKKKALAKKPSPGGYGR